MDYSNSYSSYSVDKQAGLVSVIQTGQTNTLVKKQFDPNTGEPLADAHYTVDPVDLQNKIDALNSQLKTLQELQADLPVSQPVPEVVSIDPVVQPLSVS